MLYVTALMAHIWMAVYMYRHRRNRDIYFEGGGSWRPIPCPFVWPWLCDRSRLQIILFLYHATPLLQQRPFFYVLRAPKITLAASDKLSLRRFSDFLRVCVLAYWYCFACNSDQAKLFWAYAVSWLVDVFNFILRVIGWDIFRITMM